MKTPLYKNPLCEWNSEKYHTGKTCIECNKNPAGTFWSPYWCFECNVKRMDRISSQLNQLVDSFKNG